MSLPLPPGYRLCSVCHATGYRGNAPSCSSPQCRDRVGQVQQAESRAAVAAPPITARSGQIVKGRPERLSGPRTATASGRSVPPVAVTRPPPIPAAADGPRPQPGGGQPVEFVVPGRPRPKQRARVATSQSVGWDGAVVSSTRAFTPQATKDYEALVADVARLHTRQPLRGRVRARLEFFTPSERADVDNWVKAVLDACNEIVYGDDQQVRSLVVNHWVEFEGEERVEVRFEPFDARHPDVAQ